MSCFDSMFDANFEELRPCELDLDTILGGREKFLLIEGDFFGIQKFIFDDITTKNAAKVLRAKSAYIQIFTKVLAYCLADKLGISKSAILSVSAGKFKILSQNLDVAIIADMQSKIYLHFLQKFYGLSGVGISYVQCEKDDILDANKYSALREKITQKTEFTKYSKFDLQNTEPILKYDEDITNQTLCRFCNIRKKKEDDSCDICKLFISIGKELTTKTKLKISKNSGAYNIFDDYFVTFDDKQDRDTIEIFDISSDAKGAGNWAISSYVRRNENDEIATFDELEESAVGTKALGVLKGDVDGMGIFLRENKDVQGIKNFHIFSKSIDNFFSFYVPDIAKQNYPDSYTVFAGGDDLFLMGAWNEMLELAIKISGDFKEFTKGALTLSFGFVTAKSGTPLAYLADTVEKALEYAKDIDAYKDAITAFGETVKLDGYINVRDALCQELEKLPQEDKKTAFLYSLLTFCEMSKKVKYDCDIRETMWKSKLRYSFTRNMDAKYESFLNAINNAIENNPKEVRMCVAEAIYKKRTDKSE